MLKKGSTHAGGTGQPIAELKLLRQAYADLEARLKLVMAVSTANNLKEASDHVLEAVMSLAGVDSCGIYILDPETGGKDLIAHRGLSPGFVEEVSHFDADAYQMRLIMGGKPVYKPYSKVILTLSGKVLQKEPILVVGIIPLNSQGRVFGNLNISSSLEKEFSEETRQAAEAMAGLVEAILGQKRNQGVAAGGAGQAEDHYRKLIRLLNEPAYLHHNGQVEIMNDKFREMFDFSRQESGQPEFDLFDLAAPAGRSLLRQRRRERAAATDPEPRYVFTAVSKKGREMEVAATETPIPYKHGTAFLVILRDITEQKNLTEQLRQSQKLEAMGKLAGGLAHDFNNMLHAISGYVELMENDSQVRQHKKYLPEIRRVITRAADMAKRLLAFGRTSVGEQKQIDVNLQVSQAVYLLERTIPKIIGIDTRLADDIWPINGNANQLSQVLLTLGANAAEAMPDGGRIVIETENLTLDSVSMSLSPGIVPGDYVKLTFSDTGRGMDEESISRIFDPFFTTKKTGKGAGLSLSITRSIIEAHRGKIVCRSSPGAGTAFDIYLPAAGVETAPPPAKPPGREPAERGTGTILLVDDEPDVLEMGAEFLADCGYSTLTASNGKDALDVFAGQREQIDLVVLDLNMPEMSGHVCMREMLKIKPDVKILIASGYLLRAQVQDALKPGVTDFLAKPFRMNDMLVRVRDLLNSK